MSNRTRGDDRLGRVVLGAVLIGWTGLALAMMTMSADSGLRADPVRVVVVGGYLLVGPGGGLALLLALRDRLLSVVVAVLFSFSALVFVAQASLYSGVWRPSGVTLALVGFTVVCTAFALARDLRALRDQRQNDRSAA